MSNFNISNDDIAKRAQELAKADNGCVVWQREKYLHAAIVQLELEAHQARVEKAQNAPPVFTDAELAKVMEAQHLSGRLEKCVS